jgi:transcriptional regulator with XRE-family HTH domain
MKIEITDSKSLGAAIKQRRKLTGVRIDDAAALCGMSVSTLSAIENGSRSVGIDKILHVIAKVGLHLLIEDDADD